MRLRLVVSDLSVSERFYVDQLGFTVTEREPRDGTLVRVTVSGRGCVLELSAPEQAPRFAQACGSPRERRGLELVLVSDSVRDEQTRLARAGVRVQQELHLAGPTVWEVVVADPDGYAIALQQEVAVYQPTYV
jgi:catechol 2,3-dioxygenase-like lactoylglutathione lyase family enzyme